MSFKLTVTLAACLSMTACATVDLNQAATNTPAAKSSATDVNVVQRAASKLYAAFTQKGFVAKTSRKRVQSAASILLRGLQAKEVTQTPMGYADKASDPMVVLADIRLAAGHVEQTTKAAEVYLAMAPVDTSLRKELASLEKALLASRAASPIFQDALINTGVGPASAELIAYKAIVDDLRDVTNEYGARVRGDDVVGDAVVN